MISAIGLIIYIYNFCKSQKVAKGENTFSAVTTPFLLLPIFIDCIYDISTKMEPDKMEGVGLIVTLILMIISSLFGIVYIMSYKIIYTQCVIHDCFNTDEFQPLEGQSKIQNVRRAFASFTRSKQYSEDSGDDEEEAEVVFGKNVDNLADKYTAEIRSDWFAKINVTGKLNFIWGIVATTVMITIGYGLRVYTLDDANLNRVADIAMYSGFSTIFLIMMATYDFLVFRTYSYSIFLPYIVLIVYGISALYEFNKISGAEEAITLCFLAVSSAVTAIKIKAGVDYSEAKYRKLD